MKLLTHHRTQRNSHPVVVLCLPVVTGLPEGVGGVDDDLVLGRSNDRSLNVVVSSLAVPVDLRQELTCHATGKWEITSVK